MIAQGGEGLEEDEEPAYTSNTNSAQPVNESVGQYNRVITCTYIVLELCQKLVQLREYVAVFLLVEAVTTYLYVKLSSVPKDN